MIRLSSSPPVADNTRRTRRFNVNMLGTLLKPTEQTREEHAAGRLACQGLLLLALAVLCECMALFKQENTLRGTSSSSAPAYGSCIPGQVV